MYRGSNNIISKRKQIVKRYNELLFTSIHECAYCGCDIDSDDVINYTVDHIVPLNIGGNNLQVNQKPCCLACNREKGPFTLEEWLNILYRKFEQQEPQDAHLLYKIMRIQAVKRYADRMGTRLYKQ